MKIDEELVELKRALETYTELKNIVSIEFSERCKNVIFRKTLWRMSWNLTLLKILLQKY